MAFEVGVNSYLSVAEADEIVNTEFDNGSPEAKIWGQLDTQGKQRVLTQGTRVVDRLPFLGTKVPGSSLSWPRMIAYDLKFTPYEVKLGTVKQILREMLNKDKQEVKLQELGVKSYSIKGASITFDTDISKNNKIHSIYSDIYRECFEYWVY